MKNLKSVVIAGIVMLLTACGSSTNSEFTTVKVKQVEQVVGYTYLFVKAKGPEYWLAVTTMEASPGETYHYKGGMLMQDFFSKELDRTFKKVIFLEDIFLGEASELMDVVAAAAGPESSPHLGMGTTQGMGATQGSKLSIEKSDITVDHVDGAIVISDLFSDPSAYEGKTIRISGEVVKFSPAIMERNWIHIQDGTEYGGKYDLTVTSEEYFELGSFITVEGVLALNKDFGYGYSYEILLEKATALE